MSVTQREIIASISTRRLSAGITSTTSRVSENSPSVSTETAVTLVNKPLSLKITRRTVISSVVPANVFTPSAPTNAIVINQVNKSLSEIKRGQPVAKNGPGTGIVPANASDNSKNAIGLALSDAGPEESTQVQIEGVATLSDWSEVVGTATLATNGRYFLSTTDGELTTSPPNSTGQVVQPIARAVSPTSIIIDMRDAVLL